MISMHWRELPDSVVSTPQYATCNTTYSEDNAEFEKYFRCKLYHDDDTGWEVQFDDVEYTWFVLRWP